MVLPQPDGPRSETISPLPTSNDTSLVTRCSPSKVFLRWETLSAKSLLPWSPSALTSTLSIFHLSSILDSACCHHPTTDPILIHWDLRILHLFHKMFVGAFFSNHVFSLSSHGGRATANQGDMPNEPAKNVLIQFIAIIYRLEKRNMMNMKPHCNHSYYSLQLPNLRHGDFHRESKRFKRLVKNITRAEAKT